MLRAGNQCAGPWSYIQTPDSTDLAAKLFFEPDARVRSWDGESECDARISAGHLLGIEPAYRLVTAQGRFFDCSSSHQILTESGYLRIDQLMSLSSGLHLSHAVQGYQASCVAYGYLDDLSLRQPSDSGQESLPSSVDVLERNLIFSQEDAEGQTRQYTTTSGAFGLLAIFVDDPQLLAGLFERFAAPKMRSPVLSLSDQHYKNLQLVVGLGALVQSSPEFDLGDATQFSLSRSQAVFDVSAGTIEGVSSAPLDAVLSLCARIRGSSVEEFHRDAARKSIFYPWSHPVLVGGEKITAIVDIGYQPIIDCNIPDVNNYIAAGIISHNCGKTYSGAAEMAYHLSGKYPTWWEGKRFDKPIAAWACGVSGVAVRDSIQALLIGEVGKVGTGFIPQHLIAEMLPARGVADLMDTIIVNHVSGGKSRLKFKYYEQGREKFQAETLQVVWLDEECDEGIYTECLTRTNATGGIVWMTFTPLLGMSKVVRRFLSEPSEDRADINMTIEDAEHIPIEERKKIIASYPAHERDARLNGIPMLGSGGIFSSVPESLIACEPLDPKLVPNHWSQIGGLDFGWDHPTAAVRLLYDPDGDVIYVTHAYRQSEATPLHHAAAIRSWSKGLWFAWPHDGMQHDKGSGEQLKDAYSREGLSMLGEHAQFPDDRGNGVEAGIVEMLMRMETGRFKVYKHLTQWFEEFRMYHRKDGKVVKEYDDLLCATRYACMMMRFATYIFTERKKEGQGQHTSAYNPLSPQHIAQDLGSSHKYEYDPFARR